MALSLACSAEAGQLPSQCVWLERWKQWKGITMAEIGSVKAESAMCPRIDAVEWLQDVYDIAKSWGLDLMS